MAYAKYREATALPSSSWGSPHGIIHDGVWVGTGGNITCIFADDSVAVVLNNVPDGTLLPFELKEVTSTVTADDLILVESGMKGSG